jgi:hypothetical protein
MIGDGRRHGRPGQRCGGDDRDQRDVADGSTGTT